MIKKQIYGIILLLAFCMGSRAQNVITLDLKTAVDNGDYTLDDEHGKWTETYNPAENILSFNNGMFNFSHMPSKFGGADVGGDMSYWDGFTLCSSGDTTDYGMVGNSDGWVTEQWGCMAGGGLNENMEVEQGYPYLVGYWGFFAKEQTLYSCRVDFDGNVHKAKGVYVCNHPWPYYGNMHGDGFASAFTEEGSYFTITAHGLLGGEDTGSEVSLTLAENIGDGQQYGEDWPEGLVQSNEWQWMPLEELGDVDGIYFTMETSDADPMYGPNTATYFCMDRMQIYESEESMVPQRPNGLTADGIGEEQVTLHWNNSDDADSWMLYLDDEFVGETTDTLYTYTSLSPYTEYTLKVVAVNEVGQSDPASIKTKTIDETAPTTPAEITAEVLSPYSIALSWTASEDNVGVTRYRVFVNGVQESRPKTNNYTLTGLDPDTEYTIAVDAVDASGNTSEQVVVKTRTERILPPLPDEPQELTATNIGETEITIAWKNDENAESWVVSINDNIVETMTEPSYTISGLHPFTEYTVSVVAQNEAGVSTSAIIQATTIDETAPDAPATLSVDNSTAYTLVLSWSPALDNDTVVEYNVYLGDELIATVDTDTYTVSDLESDEEFSIAIEAVDRAGNVSPRKSVTAKTSDDDPLAVVTLVEEGQTTIARDLHGNIIKVSGINELPQGIYIINNKKIRIK